MQHQLLYKCERTTKVHHFECKANCGLFLTFEELHRFHEKTFLQFIACS